VHLLFVCTGNTCRSPLAEAIARNAALDRGRPDIVVSSAGTSAWDGAPASDGALLVGIERELDLNAHRSRMLGPELVETATLILAMGPHHIERIAALGGATKAHLLTNYAERSNAGRAISDPFGGDLDAYRATTDELDALVGRVFDRIMNDRPMSSP
jgi:protein-tyrosine-phosphatase